MSNILWGVLIVTTVLLYVGNATLQFLEYVPRTLAMMARLGLEPSSPHPCSSCAIASYYPFLAASLLANNLLPSQDGHYLHNRLNSRNNVIPSQQLLSPWAEGLGGHNAK